MQRSLVRLSLLLIVSVLASPVHAEASRRSEAIPNPYVRITLGLGLLTSNGGDEPDSFYAGSQDQLSVGSDLLVGVQLSRHSVCGGALFLESGLSRGSGTQDQATPNRLVSSRLIGPFFDYYPESANGVHLGTSAGVSWTNFESVTSNSIHAFGIGGAFWFGEDFALDSRWSVGPLIRVMVAHGRDTQDSQKLPWAQSLTLSFAVVYR